MNQASRLAFVGALAVAGCDPVSLGGDPGWSLRGSAHSSTGTPLQGATAHTICRDNQAPLPDAIADANGEFRGRGLGYFRDDCSVEVRAKGYQPQRFLVRSACTKRTRDFGCLEVDVQATLGRTSDLISK
jgi:hypothetical protein